MKGHIKTVAPKTFDLVINLGRDENGLRHNRWERYHGKKGDAEARLAELIHQHETGALVDSKKATVAAFLTDWLKNYASNRVSGLTFQRYSILIKKSIIPTLGTTLLAKLQPTHLQALYTRLMENGRTIGKGGLSASTVRQVHAVLHKALRCAVKWGFLPRNIADAVEAPRPRPKEATVPTPAEIANLLAYLQTADPDLRTPTLVAAATGMRRGELLALTWANVDLERGSISVTQSLEETLANGVVVKQPKTASSRRTVAVPAMVAEALRSHSAAQAARKLAMGAGYKDIDFVFADLDGSMLVPSLFSKRFKRSTNKCKLPIRFHDLRHACATMLLRQGVHPKIVSERLGHSTIGITLNLYSHVTPDMQRDAAEQLDNVLRLAIRNHAKG
jgi:integrase